MKNLLLICLGKTSAQYDGFPLVAVLFEIVENCLNLLDIKANNATNKFAQHELSYWKHHRKVFFLICEKYFDNDVYETFQEYVYHMLLSFLFAWRFSAKNLDDMLQWNIDKYEELTQESEKAQTSK